MINAVHTLRLTYNSIHHYLIPCKGGWLLLDPGWAGTLPQLRASLGRYGVAFAEVRYVMHTHAHPDHGGLTQEVKNAAGAKLLIHERQIPYLGQLKAFHEREGKGGYVPITVNPGDLVVGTPNRQALAAIGIAGEIVETPGHSEDSVSLVLDGGIALVGDLRLPGQSAEGSYEVVKESWRRLWELGVRKAEPGHGEEIAVSEDMIG